ncbi:hypothetical protein B0J12DRAFT_587413 [Macrophomina phaseolina]|uniref:Alcohol dehydrogenase superfamily zinc-containing n=1 Tax=Macrophomina phaseolina TaxID=35725 RepID=A0ABQ8FPN6_9PEZI|nr:hypothetical protein B0J12DRAFT_587413 [Macrophomina phaseolina]
MTSLNTSLPATMRGVAFSGPWNVTVQDFPTPQIISPGDAIVRITTSAICGSDLFSYRGFSADQDPFIIGHEAIGYIEQIGSGVSSLAVGDYVVIPDNVNHGQLQMEPEMPIAYGGGAYSPGIGGLQAEYARVPAAEANLIPVPLSRNSTNATLEHSYLMAGDIWATGWTALDWSGFQPGDTVAVFGAGPVGILAAYSAVLRGASRVYSVDHVAARLELAESIGAIPINFVESNPVEQILAYEPTGVMRSVDCVGMEALNANLEFEPAIVTQQMVEVTHFEGGIGQIGVQTFQEGTYAAEHHSVLSPNISFPLSNFWTKSLSFRGGVVPPQRVAPHLVELIANGMADTSFIVSAIIGIEEAPEYYARFNRTEETKVLISFY